MSVLTGQCIRHQSAPFCQTHGRINRIKARDPSNYGCSHGLHAVPSGDAASGAPFCQLSRRANLSALASLIVGWHSAAASSETIPQTVGEIADLEVIVILISTAVAMGPSLHCRLVCPYHDCQNNPVPADQLTTSSTVRSFVGDLNLAKYDHF